VITSNSTTTGILTGGTISVTDASGNYSLALEKYVHICFDPLNENHMAAYAHLREKGKWPDEFVTEMESYGVHMGEPAIWRDLLDLRIHKTHGGLCANREQLLLDFLAWAETSEVFLSQVDSDESHFTPLDDAEAAELVRAYLASLR
jgi:hypothetical protein